MPHTHTHPPPPLRGRFSKIPPTLIGRSRPPPDSDDDDDVAEYDAYGWFKFESDPEGVRRLDRQWLPYHDLALAQGFFEALDEWEQRKNARRKAAGLEVFSSSSDDDEEEEAGGGGGGGGGGENA